MIVYVLFYQDRWDGDEELIGVFSSTEKVKEAEFSLTKTWPHIYSTNTDRWRVSHLFMDEI